MAVTEVGERQFVGSVFGDTAKQKRDTS